MLHSNLTGIYTKVLLGKLGQALVYSEVLKQGVNCYILGNLNIRSLPDLIIEGNIGVEIKTSIYNERSKRSTYNKSVYAEGWQFGEIKRSIGDYCVFVLLEKDLSLYKFITIPKNIIKSNQFFYLRPSENSFRGKGGRTRKETCLNLEYEGLGLLLKHLRRD